MFLTHPLNSVFEQLSDVDAICSDEVFRAGRDSARDRDFLLTGDVRLAARTRSASSVIYHVVTLNQSSSFILSMSSIGVSA